ncbi:hypothetical protein MRX96_036832 [Rhipicephalus microplus]
MSLPFSQQHPQLRSRGVQPNTSSGIPVEPLQPEKRRRFERRSLFSSCPFSPPPIYAPQHLPGPHPAFFTSRHIEPRITQSNAPEKGKPFPETVRTNNSPFPFFSTRSFPFIRRTSKKKHPFKERNFPQILRHFGFSRKTDIPILLELPHI